jgi:hypothetical protein
MLPNLPLWSVGQWIASASVGVWLGSWLYSIGSNETWIAQSSFIPHTMSCGSLHFYSLTPTLNAVNLSYSRTSLIRTLKGKTTGETVRIREVSVRRSSTALAIKLSNAKVISRGIDEWALRRPGDEVQIRTRLKRLLCTHFYSSHSLQYWRKKTLRYLFTWPLLNQLKPTCTRTECLDPFFNEF